MGSFIAVCAKTHRQLNRHHRICYELSKQTLHPLSSLTVSLCHTLLLLVVSLVLMCTYMSIMLTLNG